MWCGLVVIPIFTLLVFSLIMIAVAYVKCPVLDEPGYWVRRFIRYFNVDNPNRSPLPLTEVKGWGALAHRNVTPAKAHPLRARIQCHRF
jgi:hypothetical protein